MKKNNTVKYSIDKLNEDIVTIFEELSKEEVLSISVGTSLLHDEMNLFTVEDLIFDEHSGELVGANLVRFEAPDSEMDKVRSYEKFASIEDLEDYEIS